MGIIKDLKNIFFGASAITKSASEKAGDLIKEEGTELLEKTKDIASDSGDFFAEKTAGLKDAVLEGSSDILGKGKEKFGDIKEAISESPITGSILASSEEIGSKVSHKSQEFLEKAGEMTENLGNTVMDKGAVMMDKTKDLSEEVGEKVFDIKDKVIEKAGIVKEKFDTKLDETMVKAEAWEAEQIANPKKEFAEDTIDASGSLLEGTDDFFSKADKFASGEYQAFSEGKITIDETTSSVDKAFEDKTKASGFIDLDGDGNEIIDDAIVEDN